MSACSTSVGAVPVPLPSREAAAALAADDDDAPPPPQPAGIEAERAAPRSAGGPWLPQRTREGAAAAGSSAAASRARAGERRAGEPGSARVTMGALVVTVNAVALRRCASYSLRRSAADEAPPASASRAARPGEELPVVAPSLLASSPHRARPRPGEPGSLELPALSGAVSGGAPGSSTWKVWPARTPCGMVTSYSLPWCVTSSGSPGSMFAGTRTSSVSAGGSVVGRRADGCRSRRRSTSRALTLTSR